jgi:hypothetical protein
VARREHVAPLLFKRLKESDARARDSTHLWPYYVRRSADLLRLYGRATLRRGLRLTRVREREGTSSLSGWLKSGRP